MKQFTGQTVRQLYNAFESWRNYSNSRKQAKSIREEIIRKKGYSVLNKKLRNEISLYAQKRFGSAGYAPWLETYTELREEFKEGWIPDDYYSYTMLPEMNPKSISNISAIKTLDHRLFTGFMIQPLALLINGHFFTKDFVKMEPVDLLKVIRDISGEIVLKRDEAPSGRGLTFLKAIDFDPDKVNKSFNYVIQPVIHQHQNLKSIHKYSVNTLRINTLFQVDGSIKVVSVSLRFGRNKSRVDNTITGGGFMYIAEDGLPLSVAYNKVGQPIGERHPDSGFFFGNLIVPSATNAIQLCKKYHQHFPFTRFIAWDVCIDETGVPRLLEWNSYKPGIWIDEALTGPLWS
jgi:hypothetical protein